MTRGVAVKPLLAYVQVQGGQATLQRVLAQLPEEDRVLLVRPVAATGEYRTALMSTLLHLICKEILNSNHERMTEVGVFFIDEIMNSIYRTFLSLAPIPVMIKKMPILFHRFHDQGSLTAFDVEKRSARAKLEHPLLDVMFCRVVFGILTRSFELLKAEDVVLTHERCVAGGDPCCVYHARWK